MILEPRDEAELIATLRQRGREGRELSRAKLVSHGAVDGTSMTIRAGAGLTLAAIDELLRPHGLCLHALPAEARALTLGAFLEGPWAGLHAVEGGRLEPICSSLAAVLPDGRRFETSRAPRSAAGPELAALVLGASGRFAWVTEATLRCRPRGERLVHHAWAMPDVASAIESLRRGLASGALPAEVRLAPRGTSVHLTALLSGSAEGIERDRQSLSLEGGAPAAPALDAATGPWRECSWEDVQRGLLDGATLTLARLSLATVVCAGGERGLPLEGAPAWSAASNLLLTLQGAAP